LDVVTQHLLRRERHSPAISSAASRTRLLASLQTACSRIRDGMLVGEVAWKSRLALYRDLQLCRARIHPRATLKTYSLCSRQCRETLPQRQWRDDYAPTPGSIPQTGRGVSGAGFRNSPSASGRRRPGRGQVESNAHNACFRRRNNHCMDHLLVLF
jgi:hypothetical protein